MHYRSIEGAINPLLTASVLAYLQQINASVFEFRSMILQKKRTISAAQALDP